jgi:hypothetical protein
MAIGSRWHFSLPGEQIGPQHQPTSNILGSLGSLAVFVGALSFCI